MEYVIFFFLLSWKYEQDMEKLRARQEAEFQRWSTEYPGAGNGAAIAAASALAACCMF